MEKRPEMRKREASVFDTQTVLVVARVAASLSPFLAVVAGVDGAAVVVFVAFSSRRSLAVRPVHVLSGTNASSLIVCRVPPGAQSRCTLRTVPFDR